MVYPDLRSINYIVTGLSVQWHWAELQDKDWINVDVNYFLLMVLVLNY